MCVFLKSPTYLKLVYTNTFIDFEFIKTDAEEYKYLAFKFRTIVLKLLILNRCLVIWMIYTSSPFFIKVIE